LKAVKPKVVAVAPLKSGWDGPEPVCNLKLDAFKVPINDSLVHDVSNPVTGVDIISR